MYQGLADRPARAVPLARRDRVDPAAQVQQDPLAQQDLQALVDPAAQVQQGLAVQQDLRVRAAQPARVQLGLWVYLDWTVIQDLVDLPEQAQPVRQDPQDLRVLADPAGRQDPAARPGQQALGRQVHLERQDLRDRLASTVFLGRLALSSSG